jgi:hypothetical protein
MEPVRDLIVAKKYEITAPIDKPAPLPSWNKYPCEKLESCTDTYCDGYVMIAVDIGVRRSWIYLEIRFFRAKQRAFIRADNPQMLELFRVCALAYESLDHCIEAF